MIPPGLPSASTSPTAMLLKSLALQRLAAIPYSVFMYVVIKPAWIAKLSLEHGHRADQDCMKALGRKIVARTLENRFAVALHGAPSRPSTRRWRREARLMIEGTQPDAHMKARPAAAFDTGAANMVLASRETWPERKGLGASVRVRLRLALAMRDAYIMPEKG